MQGHASLNRAVDGDVVAVELLPGIISNSFYWHEQFFIGHDNNKIINYIEDKWTSPSDIVLEDQEDQDPGIRYLYSIRG